MASFCTLMLAQSANISVAVIETYPFAKAYNRSPRKFCKDLIRTYAVGGLSTWQSGTFHFRRVRLFRAERGTTAPNKIGKYHAAAGKKPPIVLPNNAPA